MEEQIKCPVCGKVGISDYHKEKVVCPCCGTDLSIYKMLTDSQNAHTPQKANDTKWKIATAILTIFFVAVLIVLFTSKPVEKIVVDNDGAEKEVVVLKDSIQKLTNQLSLMNQKQTNNDYGFLYVVQKNDSPCRISKKLYGTERRYKEIEAVITKPLQPGDTLKIK